MEKFIFKNIELSQWIKPHLTTYCLAADDDELETLQDDYDRFKNIKFLTWDKTPSSEELSKIQALIIEEPESGEYDISDLPDWINTLGNLKVLAFPYVCFSKLENTIKNSALTLETLYFFIPREWDDEKFEIPASLEMPNLSAFISRCEINGLFGLKANNFPNISYLECNISKYKNISKACYTVNQALVRADNDFREIYILGGEKTLELCFEYITDLWITFLDYYYKSANKYLSEIEWNLWVIRECLVLSKQTEQASFTHLQITKGKRARFKQNPNKYNIYLDKNYNKLLKQRKERE